MTPKRQLGPCHIAQVARHHPSVLLPDGKPARRRAVTGGLEAGRARDARFIAAGHAAVALGVALAIARRVGVVAMVAVVAVVGAVVPSSLAGDAAPGWRLRHNLLELDVGIPSTRAIERGEGRRGFAVGEGRRRRANVRIRRCVVFVVEFAEARVCVRPAGDRGAARNGFGSGTCRGGGARGELGGERRGSGCAGGSWEAEGGEVEAVSTTTVADGGAAFKVYGWLSRFYAHRWSTYVYAQGRSTRLGLLLASRVALYLVHFLWSLPPSDVLQSSAFGRASGNGRRLCADRYLEVRASGLFLQVVHGRADDRGESLAGLGVDAVVRVDRHEADSRHGVCLRGWAGERESEGGSLFI